MLTPYVMRWLRALLFTQIVEVPIYRRMLGVKYWQALLPTFVTHPFVWFAFPQLRRLGISYVVWVTIAEVTVWLVEAVMLARFAKVPWRRGLLVSLVGNGLSLALGILANELFGGI